MTDANPEHHDADPCAFLNGGGETGQLIRSLDWSGTPLGPVESWPQSLRTTVNICLASDLPICVIWGPGLVQIYNDGYRIICGDKHPRSMGQNFSECWKEAWPVIGEAHDSALAGDTAFLETQHIFLERYGYLEECFFTFSFSPIRDEAGRVGGLFHPVIEMTAKMLGERRTRALRDLAARTSKAKSVSEALALSAQALAEYDLDFPFVLLYSLDTNGFHARLAGSTGLTSGTPASPKTVGLGVGETVWPLGDAVRSGSAVLVDDVARRLGPPPYGPYDEPPNTALVLPILLPGTDRPAAVLVVGVSPRLPLNEEYRNFYDLIASGVTAAVANARVHEQERQRAEALAELDRAKTVFFSNVSHEFRTPLTLMLGPVEDMLARSHSELTPAAKDQLEVVNRNGLRLLRLVNTLLDFSRIEAGRVRAVYQPTDLATFTADLASVFRSACERAGLRLAVDCPAMQEPVFVDREMWEKVVLNLLSNAFKFTFDGEIAVSLRRTGDHVELLVRDTGTGVPAEEMPRLFERFHRVENARGRTHEGSGIGLALVQELVRLHGGSIAAQSEEGLGTTFSATLPLGSAHLPPDQIGEVRSAPKPGSGASPYVEEALRWLPDDVRGESVSRSELPTYLEPLPTPYIRPVQVGDDRPRVLVADDNADMREYVARLLAEHYRIQVVPDGEAALATALERPPDLVLTDVMMPRLDGFGLLRRLRADPRTRNVPVIMLSARAGEESRVEGMEAGADDYLIKPFGARELLARVAAHLQMARMRKDASEALRQSHARFEALFDAAPVGVYLVDANLRIRQVNPKASPVFGDIEGLIGSDFVEVMHIIWPLGYAGEIVERFRHTLETGEPYFVPEHVEERLDRKVVEYYEWQLHRLTLPDGQYGVVCYFSDISRHVLTRLAIAEADRRKDEFLAMLSHELRNPLAPITNAVQILSLQKNEDKLQRQARTIIERQVGQLTRLVDDLLEVSRITTGRIHLQKERIGLNGIVERAVETTRPLMDQHRHELAVSLSPQPIWLDADPTRVEQVIVNLLTNAAKYTHDGGRISLIVQQEDDEAVLRVKDTGVGMAPQLLPHIFELFTQAERSLDRSQGGLGIGLSLVQRMVEMHGGRVEVSSVLGQGSEFVVRLPLMVTPASQPQSLSEDTSEQTGPSLRVLVVDDNMDAAQSLGLLLEASGHHVRTAYDGPTALEVAFEFRPNIALLDIGLPGIDGFEIAKRLRQDPSLGDVVLVAMTGYGKEIDKLRSHNAGFNHHLVKPADFRKVKQILATVSEKSI